MLQIPEAAQWLPQNTPAILEARGPLMLPEVARELDLNETQVVEALVRVRGERMELYLNGRSIEVPPGWRLSPGQTVWLTAHSNTQGLWVLRQHASQAIAQRALNASAAKAAVSKTAAKPGSAAVAPAPASSTAATSGASSTAAKVTVTPEQAAASARVERAKVVLQARADGQDPVRVLAKQTTSERAPAGGAEMARMPRATASPAAPLQPQVTTGDKPMFGREALVSPSALPRDGPVRSGSALRAPAMGPAPMNTSLAPYWRALPARPEVSQAPNPLPAQVPSAAAAFRPWSPMAIQEAPPAGPAASPLVPSASASQAALPVKWAGVWGQPAAPEFIDWRQASPRVRELAAHPPGMQAVMQLFHPQVLSALLQNPGLAQWAQLVFRERMSMRAPDVRVIQDLVEAVLQPTEAQVAKGHAAAKGTPDVRAMLGDLLRVLREQGDGHAATVRAALSDVEAAQLDHLRALHQREWSFQCVLPFADAPAVQLHLQREPQAPAEEKGAWTHKWWLNLFTESEGLGQVWMRSGVASDAAVEMQVWATRAHVVSDAQARLGDLRDLLAEAGLQLNEFVITHGAKPQGPSRAPPPHGVVLDQQA